jgi:hypothetical protein
MIGPKSILGENHWAKSVYPLRCLCNLKLVQIQICYSLYYNKTPSQFLTLGKCVGYDSLSMMRNIPMPQSHFVMFGEDGKEN